MPPTGPDQALPGRRIAFCVAVAGWNVLQNRIAPRWAYPMMNGLGAAGIVGAGRLLGLSDEAMGLDPAKLRRGIVAGGAVAAAAAGLMAAVARRRPSWFRDARVAGTNPFAETLARIPIGTALFEEVVFRGVADPLLGRKPSAVLFGLWHVLPTIDTARRNAAPVVPTVAAGVAVTTAGGRALSWLRDAAGSLAAPVVVHAGVNIAAYLAARCALRRTASAV